jgi:hypothetical protein
MRSNLRTHWRRIGAPALAHGVHKFGFGSASSTLERSTVSPTPGSASTMPTSYWGLPVLVVVSGGGLGVGGVVDAGAGAVVVVVAPVVVEGMYE